MRESSTDCPSPVPAAVSEVSAVLDAGADFREAWKRLEKARLARLSIPTEAGGDGGGLADVAELLHATGYQGLALPVAETALLAGWALSASGMFVPEGPLAAVFAREEEMRLRRDGTTWLVHGIAGRVPWAREVGRLVVVVGSGDGDLVAVVDTEGSEIIPRENLAGEPRDDVRLDGVRPEEVAPAGENVSVESMRIRGALARSIMLAGALDRALELSVEHAGKREQFGRNIGRFQAIQQQIALLAGEVAAVDAASRTAVNAAASAKDIRSVWAEIAATKARASMAAGSAASIAHQVHGAVGFTENHDLHRATLRLWSWREEFGGESESAEILGGRLAALGAEGLWDAVIDPAATFGDIPKSQGGAWRT